MSRVDVSDKKEKLSVQMKLPFKKENHKWRGKQYIIIAGEH